MSRHGAAARGDHDAGFALFVLLALIGVGSIGLLLVVERFLPPMADAGLRAERAVDAVAAATAGHVLEHGALPQDLDTALATSAAAEVGRHRRDAWASPQDVGFAEVPAGCLVRSVGPDRTAGNADDVVRVVVEEPLVRKRQRLRLRMLRAVYVRLLEQQWQAAGPGGGGNGNGNNGNAYAYGQGNGNNGNSNGDNGNAYGNTGNGNGKGNNGNGNGNGGSNNGGTPGNGNGNNGNGNGNGGSNNGSETASGLREAVRDYAIARRLWWSADAATRVSLTQRMDAAAAVIAAVQAAAGWTQPPSVTGTGGLMQRLGVGDGRAVDGAGRVLVLHDSIAVLARGADATEGTDDDM